MKFINKNLFFNFFREIGSAIVLLFFTKRKPKRLVQDSSNHFKDNKKSPLNNHLVSLFYKKYQSIKSLLWKTVTTSMRNI